MQHSSGCLFSTFLGQGAWFRHIADIEGSDFPEGEIDDHYLYVARDLPRSDRSDDGSYWEWVNENTVITSDMHRGYVVSDGWDETHFTRGATITVGLDGHHFVFPVIMKQLLLVISSTDKLVNLLSILER